jgi:uncharacterized DUF497 family protein
VFGFDVAGRVLFIVHVESGAQFIRIFSARKATAQERKDHDF